jgi:hypothetical protein
LSKSTHLVSVNFRIISVTHSNTSETLKAYGNSLDPDRDGRIESRPPLFEFDGHGAVNRSPVSFARASVQCPYDLF